MKLLRVGCPMWAHRPWQGRFLPAGLDRHEQLAAYASWCNAVEGNTTFYGTPAPATIATWAAATPPEFRFAFKLPRSITHEHRLRDDALAEAQAFLAVIEPLGERADPVTIQLPGSFGPAGLGDLTRFLTAVPRSHRFAVEVRHPDFFARPAATRALERLLADHDAEWVTFDTETLFAAPPTDDAEREGWRSKPRVPRRPVALTDRPVVRYIGRTDITATAEGWRPWLPVVVAWLAEGRTPTLFVHTPDNVEALELARRFHDEVRELVPDLAPLPEPRTPVPTTLF